MDNHEIKFKTSALMIDALNGRGLQCGLSVKKYTELELKHTKCLKVTLTWFKCFNIVTEE